ncbi:DUF6932 family protein [Azorhizobium caulinodans]|uniref:DUF6932 family protein n=1 Tax=Azorhizobium caulinodans TaxID=7 RepID=UPI003B75BCE9
MIPPFTGQSAASRALVSPYAASATEIVLRFAQSPERTEIVRGLLAYRAALADIGIVDGFQWIDGSFVEDCETIRGRPPNDVDVVTFAHRPHIASSGEAWAQLAQTNEPLFVPKATKASFQCDAYFIDLQKPPHLLVQDTAYFNGLFSHQRDTAQWKGMVLIPLRSDDAAARAMI